MVALDITEAEQTMRESIVDDSILTQTWKKVQDMHMKDEHESIDETEFRNNTTEQRQKSEISDLSGDLRPHEVAKMFKIILSVTRQFVF